MTYRHRVGPLLALSVVAVPFLALLLISCGGGSTASTTTVAASPVPLTAADVQQVVQNAAQSVNAPLAVAVADRAGNILAVFRNAGAPTTSTGNFGTVVSSNELAIALARTAAFFSNDQAPLSSRTVRFISGIHFPPGVANAPNADLYGIENTNRGCSLNASFLPGQIVSPARSLDGTSLGLGIITGKADTMDSDPNAVNPGGVPLFKNGFVVGGVGVVSSSADIAEFAAFSGASQSGFLPTAAQLPPPGVVIIGGIALPFVNQTSTPSGVGPGTSSGTYLLGPLAGALPPEGALVGPNGGSFGLTQSDVSTIISQAVATAQITRAVIRLPPSSRTRMTIAVSDLDGTLLGLYRMHDATVFSIDVAVAKARNVIYFSSPAGAADLPGIPPATAVTNRTIGFGAQPLFPPGINASGLGPFFSLYLSDIAQPCTQGSQPPNPNQNGIVFFPGSVPLYKNGVLVGGLGVSGDGVDQDDFVTNGAAQGFAAPTAIRADQVLINGVRLPYLKFPRNPTN
ncbi:MAG: heme-binding protein [Acidobacteriia bacterium]|nr:heme-binding protein [Terriglobia bacterium]